ncbi:hypothetical protein OF846_000586 [Rhodotorula toruloides]|nr:hypothetical protein OF846_000586 [Rhodotorula toruloides]
MGNGPIVDAQEQANALVTKSREGLLQIAIDLRKAEIAKAKPMVDLKVLPTILLGHWKDVIEMILSQSDPKPSYDYEQDLAPYAMAALADLTVVLNQKAIAAAIQRQQKREAQAIRDQKAADARIAMDIDSTDRTVSEVATSAGSHAANKELAALRKEPRVHKKQKTVK